MVRRMTSLFVLLSPESTILRRMTSMLYSFHDLFFDFFGHVHTIYGQSSLNLVETNL